MRHKKKIIAASALLALFALAAIFLSPHEVPVISPSQVYTWDCELPVQKPNAITLTCGDGGMYVDHIDWSRWDAKGAKGRGVYSVNDCDPSCADGTFLHVTVSVTLVDLEQFKGKHFFRMLVIRTNDGKNLPMLDSDNYEWDIMEFASKSGNLN